MEQLTQHFQSLSKRLSWDINPPEYLVNQVGYAMLQNRDDSVRSKALAFFILNTKNYPDSFNAYDSLGEAYESLGDIKKAIENYRISLELNPNSEHAKMKIKELSKSKQYDW
jgi:tetratricopeptide (TPR) repeat protein